MGLAKSTEKLALLMVMVMMMVAHSAAVRSTKSDGSETGGGGGGRPSLTTYDQRQTGKYNIHVNIKDVKIISVDGEKFDGEFGDDTIYDYGDYDYDPSHLTISPLPIFGGGSTTAKPPKSTTKTPVSITSTKRATTTTTAATTTIRAAPMDEPSKKPAAPTANDPFNTEAKPTKQENTSHILSAPGTTTPPSSNIYIFKPTPNYYPHPVHYDYQEIPVEVIVEPVLKPRYRNANSRNTANRRNRFRKNPGPSGGPMAMDMARHSHTDIEALPSTRVESEPLEATPCTKGEYRDRSGKCRVRRSGIFRLLKLLTAFKEKDD